MPLVCFLLCLTLYLKFILTGGLFSETLGCYTWSCYKWGTHIHTCDEWVSYFYSRLWIYSKAKRFLLLPLMNEKNLSSFTNRPWLCSGSRPFLWYLYWAIIPQLLVLKVYIRPGVSSPHPPLLLGSHGISTYFELSLSFLRLECSLFLKLKYALFFVVVLLFG